MSHWLDGLDGLDVEKFVAYWMRRLRLNLSDVMDAPVALIFVGCDGFGNFAGRGRCPGKIG